MNDVPWTIGRLLSWTTEFLGEKGSESPRLDAEVLLAHACDCQRIELYTRFAEEPSDELRSSFRELVKRRAAGTPVAYLVGHREFFSLSFRVTPDVLIPRPETEQIVVRATDLSKEREIRHVADVGTGSGILAICCALHIANCQVTATDVSQDALQIAVENAASHEVNERIHFLECDLLTAVPSQQRFDLIVSNPPYISIQEMLELDPEVRDHEPHLALDGGKQGTEIIQRLLPQATERLNPGGWLLIEVSPMNAGSVEDLIRETEHLVLQDTIPDLENRPRVAQAVRDEGSQETYKKEMP